MNKVNFKCWSDTVRTEGNGSRLHAIRTIFCHTADSQERAEIVETLQKIAQEHFKDASQAQQPTELSDKCKVAASCLTYNDTEKEAVAKHLLLEASQELRRAQAQQPSEDQRAKLVANMLKYLGATKTQAKAFVDGVFDGEHTINESDLQSQGQQQDNQPVAWRLSYFKKGEKPATWNDNTCDRPKLFLDEELANGKLDEVHTFERIETAFIEPLYLQSQAQQESQWQPIATAPKNRKIIVRYKNIYGKDRTVFAKYIEKFTEEAATEYETDYCESDDTYYLKEGWVELIDNWDEFSSVYFDSQNVPTHWMPLPPAPVSDNEQPEGE